MTVRRRGFTLIELLTVIAIISILAGLVAYGVPRALQRARLASVKANMRQIQTTLASYFSENGSYPPGYGYLRFNAAGALDGEDYWLEPWHAILGVYGQNDREDFFSTSSDMDQDGVLRLLEYSPIPDAQNNYPTGLFTGGAGSGDVAANISLQEAQKRAFLYVPVNLDDFKKLKSFLDQPAAGNYVARQKGEVWDPNDKRIGIIANRTNAAGIAQAAPAKYDAYVLISVGPVGNSGGIALPPPPSSNINPYYHAGLLTYFIATRDVNNNGSLDYDYESRTGAGEDRGENAFDPPALQLLPNGTNGQGPLISKSSE